MKAAAPRPWRPRPAWLCGLLAAALPGGCASAVASAAVTPLQKVVQLLGGMIKAGEEEKHQEQVQYAAFEQFCTDVSAEKSRVIQEADRQLELLAAELEKHRTEVERMEEEIREHGAKMVSLQNDTEVAAEVRAAEREGYAAMHQNYSESIHALTQAISTLKRQAYSKPGAEALLQGLLGRLPADGGRDIAAFLERGSDEPDLTFVAAPEATPYEFQSGDIIKMLEQLQEKFRDELSELEKDETSRRHAYTMLRQDLENSISVEDTSRLSKQKSKAKHSQLHAEAEASYKETAATRAVDAAYLKDLDATCQQKAEEYKSRQKLRTEEIAALEKAVAILESKEVAGAAAKHLPTLPQLRPGEHRRGAVLAQLRSSQTGPSLARVAEFLREESARLSSHALSTIAMHAREDPFAKVKRLIEELLERLMTQATAEAEHKGWCDTELATNAHTRKTKTQEAEVLRADIDSLQAAVEQLNKDVASLSAEVAEIDAEVGNATAMRSQEKARNANTTREAQQAQAAVAEAIKLLQDFYAAAAANATALAQRVTGRQAAGQRRRQDPPPVLGDDAPPVLGDDAPPIWGDDAYSGQQAESGGVLAMLHVIQSDFARLESHIASAETQAAEAHKTFLTDSSISRVQKQTDIKHKTADRQNKELALDDKQRALGEAERTLASAEEEYDKLRPVCLSEGQSYEERVQRREDEIEALKKALEILSGS